MDGWGRMCPTKVDGIVDSLCICVSGGRDGGMGGREETNPNPNPKVVTIKSTLYRTRVVTAHMPS